ncbi:MAG: hypothetical protein V7K89_04140 [Nostoc sp.]|uniref:hypothetical protein n=1 Tax=Nostoc sp. TaxID=1180 RepID=UPI002FFAC4BE
MKTLQNCNTKALLASVGHFQEKFILGLQYRARRAEEQRGSGAGGAAGEELLIIAQCLMPNAR